MQQKNTTEISLNGMLLPLYIKKQNQCILEITISLCVHECNLG